MKPIIIHDQAKQGLGLDFLAEVETALEKIKLNPNIGLSYTIKGLRRYVMRPFPYSIFYAELAGLIWVVAIAHSKRKPDYWKKRRLDN